MSNPFRFTIVGSGNISRTYVMALERVANAELAAMVSRSLNRPEFLPDHVQVFRSMEEVDVPFDAVILATPNGMHHDGAVAAAKQGKHVLTEKVLEITTTKMDSMIAACEAAGVSLAVTYQRRMSPDNMAVKELLDSGQLGRVFAVDLRVKFYRDQAYYDSAEYRGGYAIDGGGPFMQQAAHNVDVYCWLFGIPDQVVSMLDTFLHDIEVEDHGVALMHHVNGMIGTITASTCTQPGFAPCLEIHSDRGSIVMENDNIVFWSIDGVPNPAARDDFEVHSGADSAAVDDTAGHEAILSDFAESVRENRAPAVPATSARLATDLILKIYEADLLRQSKS